MSRTSDTLRVRLGAVTVGHLLLGENDRSTWVPDTLWVHMPDRPVLGQQFEDAPANRYTKHVRLPPFFSNLLPERESPLRRRIAEAVGVKIDRESRLLAHVGLDLPGAVIVEPVDASPVPPPMAEMDGEPARDDTLGSRLRFSLAGVQLKFSMLRQDKALIYPASGRGGNWLVKLPHPRYPDVPQNEGSVMSWAAACGFEVPPHLVVEADALEGLPEPLLRSVSHAFAIARYDRTPNGRVHQEDFAQVGGLYPEAKYDGNYETVARRLLVLCGREDAIDFVRRLAFVVASGNNDAHLKNWSLIYPDGIHPRLAPVYDQVSTLPYHEMDRKLALRLGGVDAFETVGISTFERFARRVGLDEREVSAAVEETWLKARDAWTSIADAAPASLRAALAEHWQTVPMLRQLGWRG
ncbi:MAG: HipA domain-containing protein [Myxococcales bacterium]|nr:HipA domain-containing protein [Myxococcales bacterium]